VASNWGRPLFLVSPTVPSLSYQLHTSDNCNPQVTQQQLKVNVMLRTTVSRTVYLNTKPPSGAQDKLSDSCVFVEAGRLLWRQDASIIYNCCWPSPAQSFSGLSPAGLMTTFYCLRFETPATWRARSPYLYPPGTVWLSYIPRNRVPFSPPPTTRRAKVEVLEPASTRASQS
jgi:hypothetical protein